MSAVRRHRKGQLTRATILAAATDLLLQDGYGKFVFRDVAKRAHVAPGNVQYYFSSKRDLLWAVLEPELQNYLERLAREIKKGKTASDKVNKMVRYLIKDVSSERTLRLWLSIWSMATHDAEIAGLLGDWYRAYMRSLSGLLMEVFPGLDRDRADEAAMSITAHFDGLLICLQIGKPKLRTIARARRNIDAVILRIINAH